MFLSYLNIALEDIAVVQAGARRTASTRHRSPHTSPQRCEEANGRRDGA